jgi:hypothetical protein
LPAPCLALLVALLPLGLLAANPFDDLTGGPHDANIEAIYNAGVTRGCVPDVSYCPTDYVTREEMASFLARLGGLGSNPPAANARTLQGYAPSGLARAARGEGTASERLGTTPRLLAQVTVEAPGNGIVLLTGVASPYVPPEQGFTCPCVFRAELRDDATPANSSPWTGTVVTGTFSFGAVQDTWRWAVANTWAFPVAAGTRTFGLYAWQVTGQQSFYGQGTLTALYVPFGRDGGTTLGP